MATTITYHRTTRHVLQGRTPIPVSVTAMDAALSAAYAAMAAAAWRPASSLTSNLPRHDWQQTGTSDAYDAYAYCGDYDTDLRTQHAYMGAVDYCLKTPTSASAKNIVSVQATLHGDRWLADGAKVSVIPSASATPPTWAQVLAATTQSAAVMAVVPGNTGPDSTYALDIDLPALTNVTAYIHVVLRLASYATRRGAWIEGGAMLDASTLQVEYTGTVTADAAESIGAVSLLSAASWLPNEDAGFLKCISSLGYAPYMSLVATAAEWRAVMYDYTFGSAQSRGDDYTVGATIFSSGAGYNNARVFGRAFTRSFYFYRTCSVLGVSWATAFAPASGSPFSYRLTAYALGQVYSSGGYRINPSPSYMHYNSADDGAWALLDGRASEISTKAVTGFTSPVRTYSVLASASVEVLPGTSVSSLPLTVPDADTLTCLVIATPLRMLSLPGTGIGDYVTTWNQGVVSATVR
jgi:hypothetical protein